MSEAVAKAMIWLNKTFGQQIEAALAGTPIPKNLIIAIGIQETFYIWGNVYSKLPVDQALAICVGDTIDYPGRGKTWPKNRNDLESCPQGGAMFKIAREALENIARINAGYNRAKANPDKFCHGFGMFQYDIQYFKTDPDYFIQSKWKTFKGTLDKCVSELKSAREELYGKNKKTLTHDETVYLAIAYNQGVKRTKEGIAKNAGFRMGHKDDGLYYGEHIDQNLLAMKNLW